MALYIFDKDGTICRSRSGKKFINSIDDQELFPDVAEKCAALQVRGHKLAVASNQGGVAWDGLMTESQAREIIEHSANLIKADAWAVCPHHPKGNNGYAIGCECRKPKPGMILQLASQLGFALGDVIFIGDMDSDKEAAQAAGVEFRWADGFFGRLQ